MSEMSRLSRPTSASAFLSAASAFDLPVDSSSLSWTGLAIFFRALLSWLVLPGVRPQAGSIDAYTFPGA